MILNTNNKDAVEYWEERFTSATSHHSSQNVMIASDFIRNITPTISKSIIESSSIIEIGCGTGELSYILNKNYGCKIIGTDLSEKGMEFANSRYSNENLSYKVFDCFNQKSSENYSLSICSNTLEHFLDPFAMIDKILEFSEKLILLVPFNQPVTDGYSCEGGAGHVFHFTDDSFSKYKVLDSFKFSTPGWQYSSKGEVPLQLCVLLTK